MGERFRLFSKKYKMRLLCLLISVVSIVAAWPVYGGDIELPVQEQVTEVSEGQYVDTTAYASLKEVYSNYFQIGVAMPNMLLTMPEHIALIKRQFGTVTMENECKPDYLFDEVACKGNPDLYKESPAVKFDALTPGLEFCKNNNLKMRGHTLIWHNQTPQWIFYENYDETGALASRELMLKRMEQYIKQVMEYTQEQYPDVIMAWDVVNEAIDDETGLLRDSLWKQTIGDDYLEKAFAYARQYAAPDVKLFYNDYNEYIPNKRDGILQALTPIKVAGNIDGIGMQSHVGVYFPSIDWYMEAVNQFAQAGYVIHVTELDVEKGDTDDWEKVQADYYYALMQGLLEAKHKGLPIESLTFWGIADGLSWKNEKEPLLLHEDLSRKAAFDKVIQAAQEANAVWGTPTPTPTDSPVVEPTKMPTVIPTVTVVPSVTPIAPKLQKVTARKTSVTSNRVTLSWKDVKDETGYVIYRKKTGAAGFKKIKTVKSGVTTYKDSKLASATTYEYKVCAYKKWQQSLLYGAGSSITVTTKPADTKATAKVVSNKNIKITWKNVPRENGYIIMRKVYKGKWKVIKTTKQNTTSYIDKTAAKHKKYYYKIRAYTKTKLGKVYGNYTYTKGIKIVGNER